MNDVILSPPSRPPIISRIEALATERTGLGSDETEPDEDHDPAQDDVPQQADLSQSLADGFVSAAIIGITKHASGCANYLSASGFVPDSQSRLLQLKHIACCHSQKRSQLPSIWYSTS